MKSAEEWIAILNDNGQSWTVTVKAIQLDALKEAAEIACDSQKYYTRSASIQCLQIHDAILSRIQELESSPEKEGG